MIAPPAEQVRTWLVPVVDDNDRPSCVPAHQRPYQEVIQEVGVVELEPRLSPDVLGVDDHGDDFVLPNGRRRRR